MALIDKCKVCNYTFLRNDGSLCPECLTSRDHRLSSNSMDNDIYQHGNSSTQNTSSYSREFQNDAYRDSSLKDFEDDWTDLENSNIPNNNTNNSPNNSNIGDKYPILEELFNDLPFNKKVESSKSKKDKKTMPFYVTLTIILIIIRIFSAIMNAIT